MNQENQYNYYNFQEMTDLCDICGVNSLHQADMAANDLCLCDDCSNKMFKIDDGIIKDSIIKFAVGNVF